VILPHDRAGAQIDLDHPRVRRGMIAAVRAVVEDQQVAAGPSTARSIAVFHSPPTTSAGRPEHGRHRDLAGAGHASYPQVVRCDRADQEQHADQGEQMRLSHSVTRGPRRMSTFT